MNKWKIVWLYNFIVRYFILSWMCLFLFLKRGHLRRRSCFTRGCTSDNELRRTCSKRTSYLRFYLMKTWSQSFHQRVEFTVLPWTWRSSRPQNVNVWEKSRPPGTPQIQWCRSDPVTQHEDRKRFAVGIASTQGRNHCEVSSRASETAADGRERERTPRTLTRYEKRQRGKCGRIDVGIFLETSNAVFVSKGPKLFNLHFLNTYSINTVWANVWWRHSGLLSGTLKSPAL